MKFSLKDHKIAVTKMSWDQIAEFIIDMELELFDMRPYLNPSEIRKYEKIINVYEIEKLNRIMNLSE